MLLRSAAVRPAAHRVVVPKRLDIELLPGSIRRTSARLQPTRERDGMPSSPAPRLGDHLDRFLAQLPLHDPQCRPAPGGGVVFVFWHTDCPVHVLFLTDRAVAVHCPYLSLQPHRVDVEAAAAPFQPADMTASRLLVDDHGWTLALRRCTAEQVEALVHLARGVPPPEG